MEDFVPGWTPENILVALVLLGILAFLIKQEYHSSTKWRLGLFLWVAFLLFYFVGANTLAVITDYRAMPDETGPWLLLIAIAVGYWWIKKGKGNVGVSKQGIASQPIKEPTPRPNLDADQDTPSPIVPLHQANHSIFISYRRNDSGDVTGRIYDRLLRHFPKDNIFKDVDSIPLGVDFRKHLADSVGQCQLLLAVIGRYWLGGGIVPEALLENPRDFVRIEIETALQRGIPVIPLLVQGTSIPKEDDLPDSLKPLAFHNALSIRADPDFHQDMARLVKGIEAHLANTPDKDSA